MKLRTRCRFHLLKLLALAMAFFFAPAAWSDTITPRVETLENGLKVVLLEDHASPLVAEAVWVHVGGKDETDELAGFSHYLEYLIPMGTKGEQPRQHQMEIFRAGGISSIQTDYDRTFLFTEVESSQEEMALRALYQQVAQATLPDPGVDAVRPQITRELREVYDDPAQVLFFEEMRAVFSGQPYEHPYFGNFKTLASLEHTTADAFYGNFYVANNMVVAVGGDIHASKTLERIRSLFGKLRSSKTLPAKAKFEPGAGKTRYAVRLLPRMPSSASVLFPTPGYRHPDRFALAVLARLLDDAATSPLYREMLGSARKSLSVSSSFHLMEERGLLAFTTFPAVADQAPGALTAMLSVLKEVRQKGFSEGDVTCAARELRLEAAVRRDAIGTLVQDLARGALFGDVRYGWDEESNLGRVTSDDVKRVAQAYLSGKSGKTLLILPKTGNPPGKDEEDAATRALDGLDAGAETLPTSPDFKAVLYVPGKGAPPTPRETARSVPAASRSTLPNGLVLVVKPEKGRGLVAASLEVRAGSAFDPAGKEGLSQMAASALTLGTKSISAEEFRRKVRDLGSTFGITANRETVEAGLTLFPQDLPEALSILAGPMIEPAFPEDQMGAVRDRIRLFGETLSASPVETARNLVQEKIYRDHPYARMPTGTEASLSGIKREDLVAFHRKFYRPDRAVLVLAGDVTTEDALRLATAAFGAWTAPGVKKSPPDLPEGATRHALFGEFSRVLKEHPAAVVLGFPAVPLRDPDFPLVRALGGLLSARGTLDLVIRQPLAYSVTAVPEGLSKGGILYVEATAPAKETSRVAYEVIKQARAFGLKEVTPATVTDLQAIERGRLLREKEGLYTLASNLGYYELVGAGYAAYDQGRLLPPDLNPKMLKEGAARFLNTTRFVEVTAGPSGR